MQGRKIVLCLLVMCLVSAPVAAQAPITLQETIKHAIVNNPEVQARWHAFQSALYEQDVARGGFLPRVDLSTGVGREKLAQPNLPTSSAYATRK